MIRQTTSVFLDAVRVLAASIVFINHCAQFWCPAIFHLSAPIAHRAVIVFFVLSGYVIAYTTHERDRTARRYIVSRLARLYSVVLPSLMLTALLQIIGTGINPAFYQGLSRDGDLLRYFVSACFLQNIWFYSASPPTNAPLWSLSYEFWYYVVFGAYEFLSHRWIRLSSIAALCLIVGLNILLLMPCWLLGALVYRCSNRPFMSARLSRGTLVLLLIAALAAVGGMPMFPSDLSNRSLLFSGAFLSDWFVALAVGTAILCFESLRLSAPPRIVATAIRRWADHTFSIYLYHFPLIVFATAIVAKREPLPVPLALGLALSVLALVLLLSRLTEARRDIWRVWIDAGIERLAVIRWNWGTERRPS